MKGSKIMKKGFTLAEVLITLAIIGVVAALTIPSVILNTNQSEYKTALKKAVSVLNQAVSLRLAIENDSPSEATSTLNFLQMLDSQMNTVSSPATACTTTSGVAIANGVEATATGVADCSFTTTDGIQFIFANDASMSAAGNAVWSAGQHSGLPSQRSLSADDGCTEDNPCFLLVDVNGNKNPNQITSDAKNPKDRYVIMFKGENGTTVTPVGVGGEIMFAK